MWIIVDKETLQILKTEDVAPENTSNFEEVFEYNGALPLVEPIDKYHSVHQTFNGVEFGLVHTPLIGDILGAIDDYKNLLRKDDYKNAKNAEKERFLKAKYPGISDTEITSQLPYNPIELHDLHEAWRGKINELQKLVPDA